MLKEPYSYLSVLILFQVFSSCNISEKENELIPVKYDYANLRIHLNADIDDSLAGIEWRWDYMSAPGSMPDSVGEDSYMNLRQESFKYENEETLPSLFAQTKVNHLVEFSAVTIFSLKEHNTQSVKKVLDKLSKYDLLKIDSIKNQVIHKHHYTHEAENYTEELDFQFADTQGGYSRLEYNIKNGR